MAETLDVCLSQSGCPGCETMCKTVETRYEIHQPPVIMCYAAAKIAVCRWVSRSGGISQKTKPSLSDDLNVFYFTWYLLSFRNTARRHAASYLGARRALYHFCEAVLPPFLEKCQFSCLNSLSSIFAASPPTTTLMTRSRCHVIAAVGSKNSMRPVGNSARGTTDYNPQSAAPGCHR